MHLLREIRFAGLSVALVTGERRKRKRKRQRRMVAQHRHPCVFTLPYPSLQKTKIPARGLKQKEYTTTNEILRINLFKKPKSPRGD